MKSNEGLDSVVHYVKNPEAGGLMGFEFEKQRGDVLKTSDKQIGSADKIWRAARLVER